MTNKFLDLLTSQTILADGAMGTMLHARGVGFDKCFDELNLTNPAAVAEIHREYIEAGAKLIITNTFGANRFKLAKHGLQDDMKEIRLVPGGADRRGCWSARGEDRALRTGSA
jgi:homocysteine S-methyltransferase